MAHFAQLDSDNIVTKVCVVYNGKAPDEVEGSEYLKSLFGKDTLWKQTSYNANFRKNFAGIGYTYDAQLDAFIPPKPYPSWVLDENTCRWQAPVAYPSEGNYVWIESLGQWQAI